MSYALDVTRMRTWTRKQDMLTDYISRYDLKTGQCRGQGRAGKDEDILLAKCIDRCGVSCGRFDWFLCRLLKVFNTHFYYDIREGDREIDRARVAHKLVLGEGRQRYFPGPLIKCQFAALNGGFIGRHYNSYA